jgi:hypothetical protein
MGEVVEQERFGQAGVFEVGEVQAFVAAVGAAGR